MTRKERIIKNLKRCLALLIFLVPVALYLILTRYRAGSAVLYVAPHQVPVVVLSLAAGLFSYLVLRREAADERVEEEEAPGEEKVTEHYEVSDVPLEEYPEFYTEREQEEEISYDVAESISTAISAQKETLAEETDAPDYSAWDEFVGDRPGDDIPRELYDDIPDTLPEGYSAPEETEEEEIEFDRGYTVKRWHPGETVLSKVICTLVAAALAFGTAFAASFAVMPETEEGFGKYKWSDAETVTVSQKLLSSLSVEVRTADGKKTELFPASLFSGESFSQKYDNVYDYMAHAVRMMTSEGAELTVLNGDEIEQSFKDTEDGSWEYVSEMIGAKGQNDD